MKTAAESKITWGLDKDGNLVPALGKQPVVWAPLPGSQEAFLSCPVFEVMYHGNRGSGKSLTLLMSFLQHVGKGYGSDWRGIIFRRTFPELRDIINKSKEWFPKVFPDANYNIATHTWTFKDGEELIFAYLNKAEDYWNYHGFSFTFLGFEELTTWADEEAYLAMFSCVRSSRKGIPKMVRSTTNPYGVGASWVKERFKPHESKGTIGQVIKGSESNLVRVSIRGSLAENKVLLTADPDYAQKIKQSAGANPDKVKAWLEGSWDINSAGFFASVWDSEVHSLPKINPAEIPSNWSITRGFDYGYSAPFSVLWLARSNGESIEVDGRLIGEKRGDIIVFKEWYGAEEGKPNVGIKLLSPEIAAGIKIREQQSDLEGRVKPGIADSAIWGNNDGKSIATSFSESGITWLKASKGKGSRVSGWQQILVLLEAAKPNLEGIRERPGLFISASCPNLISNITNAPRDTKNPDDIDTNCPDHDLDALRYNIFEPRKSKIVRNLRTQLF